MKKFLVTRLYLFYDCSEKDFHALRIFGDIKEIMIFILRWCLKIKKRVEDKVNNLLTYNLIIHYYLKQRGLRLLKWDMLEHFLLIVDGKKVENKDLMIVKVFYQLMQVNQIIKKIIWCNKTKKIFWIRLNKIKKLWTKI